MTTQTLNRGDLVVMKLGGRCYKDAKVIGIYPEFHQAVKLELNGAEYITTPENLESFSDYEERKARERVDKAREKYQDIIEATNLGHTTLEAIAKHLKCNASIGLVSRIKAAKRRNFIK